MVGSATKLRRGVFGYRRSSVVAHLAERDGELRAAEGRALALTRTVEEFELALEAERQRSLRLEAIQEEFETAHAELERRVQENEELRREAERLTVLAEAGESAKFLQEEVAKVLTGAQEAAAMIVSRARVAAGRELAESLRIRGEVEEECRRYLEWRTEVHARIRSAQEKIDAVRRVILDVPDQIRQSLDTVDAEVASMDGNLGNVLDVPRSPDIRPVAALGARHSFPAGGAEDGRAGPEAGWDGSRDLSVIQGEGQAQVRIIHGGKEEDAHGDLSRAAGAEADAPRRSAAT